jgi:RHS repeat-associated protein
LPLFSCDCEFSIFVLRLKCDRFVEWNYLGSVYGHDALAALYFIHPKISGSYVGASGMSSARDRLQERDTTNYLASMEAAYRSTEVQLFGNITNTSYAWSSVPNYSSIPSGQLLLYTNPNDSVARVDSNSTTGQKVGPNLLLKVMSGDTVQLGVQCFYNSGSGSTNNTSFNDVLNSLANGLVNTTGGAHGTLTNLTSSGSTVYTGLTSFLNSFDSVHSGYPKAYINWIFLDDQFNYVSGLSGSVLAASSTYPAGQLNVVAPGSQVALNRNGYLYIWVSNETQGWDVFFDNLSVQYKQGPVLEENHYYPFGLTMAGISDQAIKTGYTQNKYRYNEGSELQNKEFRDGTGLEMYDAGFRRLDPQIGRFIQIDPMAMLDHRFSTYQYAGNNPISMTDPTGTLQLPPSAIQTILRGPNNFDPTGGGYLDGSLDDAQMATNAALDAGEDFMDNMSGDGDSWIDQAEGIFNDNKNQFGGEIIPAPNGNFTERDFSSSSDAWLSWANDQFFSGTWGSGDEAKAGFNTAQQEFEAVTGQNLGFSPPVLDIGYPNGNTWVTMNMNELLDQLKGNGAIGEPEDGFALAGDYNEGVDLAGETVTNLRIGGQMLREGAELVSHGAVLVGPAITIVDGITHGYQPHQVADVTVDLIIYGIAEASGPVGWVVGGLWFLGNLAYAHYHGGRSITQDAFDPH